MEGKELVWLGLALQMFMLGLRKFGWLTTEYSSTSLHRKRVKKTLETKLRYNPPLPLETQWEEGTEKGPCGKREKRRGQQNIDRVTEERVIGALLCFLPLLSAEEAARGSTAAWCLD